jgi:multidrug efflux pump subunit AcrA (membrane-fusion protein)
MARHLSPTDIVPRLRNDLNVTSPPTGVGAEVIRVGPVGSGERVILHGFEFSIALMLDGKRTAADVIANCQKLGLPIAHENLDNFLQQLKSYGLLDAASRKSDTLPRVRPQWDPQVRMFFRAALHDAREGHVERAREDLRQLLMLAPATPEALRLLSWLEIYGPTKENDSTFQELVRDVQAGWGDDLPQSFASRTEAVIIPRKWGLLGSAAAGALVFCAMLIPLPRTVTASAELTPLNQTPITTTREGLVESVAVQEGDKVEKGDLLFTWNTEEIEAQLSDARDRVEAARGPIREAIGHTAAGAAAYERYKMAETMVIATRAALQDATNSATMGEPPDDQSEAEQRVTDAEQELEESRDALDGLTPLESADALKIAALDTEVESLEQQARDRDVYADAAGTVSHLFLKPNETVAAGQTIAQLDDMSKMKMVVVVTPQQARSVKVGEPMTVKFNGEKLATTVEAVTDYELAGEVDNANGKLKIESTPVELKLSPKSILRRLRG